MGALSGFNILLALAATLACLRSAYFMNGTTPHTLRFAFAMVFVALLGFVLGEATSQWTVHLDTLLFGGLAALLLADTRRPAAWVPWAQRAAWVVMGMSFGAVVLASL